MTVDAISIQEAHNVRSPNYQIARTVTTCWRCKKTTTVFCIMLPENHEVLETVYVDESDDGTDPFFDPSINGVATKEWMGGQGRKVYYNLQSIATSVLEELSRVSGGKYCMDRYNGSDGDTLMNHCEHCGVRQSEKSLNKPADSASAEHYAFAFITHVGPPAPIHLQTVNKPFAAFGSEWILYGGIVAEGRISQREKENHVL